MSSGLVSLRTRITFSPFAAHSTASSGLKTTLPTAAPGDAANPLRENLDLRRRVDARVEKLVELLRLHPHESLVLRDQALGHHVDGDLDRGLRRALPAARLQHVELPLLDGELEVLHVAVVALEPVGDGCGVPRRPSAAPSSR